MLKVALLFCFLHLSFCQETSNGTNGLESYCEEISENHTKLCLLPYSNCPEPEFCEQPEGHNWALAFGLTIGAGLVVNVGAALSLLPCFKRSNTTLLAIGLALAAGFLLYLAFVDVLEKTSEYFCCHTQTHFSLAGTGCFFLGILLTLLLEYFIESLQKLDIDFSPPWNKKKSPQEKKEEKTLSMPNPTKIIIEDEVDSAGAIKKLDEALDSSEIVCMTDEDGEKLDDSVAVVDSERYDDVMELLGKDTKQLRKIGIFTAISMTIHNLPEGIATFVVSQADPLLGISLAVGIALHNIPEGASIAIPIYYATGKKWKGLLLAFLCGLSEPLGALLAFLILRDIFGPLAYGFIFGLVGGMMVILSIKDLLPTARKFSKYGTVVTGFFVLGMFIMSMNIVFFDED